MLCNGERHVVDGDAERPIILLHDFGGPYMSKVNADTGEVCVLQLHKRH